MDTNQCVHKVDHRRLFTHCTDGLNLTLTLLDSFRSLKTSSTRLTGGQSSGSRAFAKNGKHFAHAVHIAAVWIKLGECSQRLKKRMELRFSLECFTHADAPSMTVLALREVNSQIYVILVAECKPNASAAAWQEVLGPKRLIAAGY